MTEPQPLVRRFGHVIGLKPEQIAAYEALHAAAWPGVLAMIHACNIRNYSIYRYGTLLFDLAPIWWSM